MEKKSEMKQVTLYQASVRFEGKWYTSIPSENIDDAMDFIRRARLKSARRYMECNVNTSVCFKAAN